ncbi:MAG: sensor histidine kinase [Eggerthellaceae bacterium]|nr:sensor histidine kinase [Eggerthellaceae bacterium]
MVLIPLSALVFIVSMLIGHYLAEPLAILYQQTRRHHMGDKFEFVAKGHLVEADNLADTFTSLTETLNATQGDLNLRGSRQETFISDVAHELRTPLTAISGNAEMLLDPDLPPDMHERFVKTIINESGRLSRLTTDLLSIERMKNTTKQLRISRVNLGDIARDVVSNLSPILSEQEANVEIIGEAPDVLGSRDKLTQMVTNLVDNAGHFIEKGGKITIELASVKDNAVIAVKDNGPGFGNVDPKLLFERFYRTDFSRNRNKGGSGLGLAIVKSIVEAHDGTVEALNLPEGGACFIVAIPSID